MNYELTEGQYDSFVHLADSQQAYVFESLLSMILQWPHVEEEHVSRVADESIRRAKRNA